MDFMNWSLSLSELAFNWILQSSLLILAGLVAARLLRKRGSAFQSAIYRTTLVAAFVCPLATWGLSQTEYSGWAFRFPDSWKTEQVAQILPEPIIASAAKHNANPLSETAADRAKPIKQKAASGSPSPTSSTNVTQPAPAPTPSTSTDDRSPATSQTSQSLPETPTIAADAQPASVPAPLPGQSLGWTGSDMARVCVQTAVFLWLAVSTLLLFRLLMGHWKMSRIRRMAIPANQPTLETCTELSDVLQVKTPQLLCSPYLSSPCLTGLIRPAVLLPEDSQKLSIREVLIHELAHLRRRDCHWNLLRHLATSLFFFHAGLWYLSRKIETSAEEVCDDFVVEHGGNREQYANRLVDIAEHSTVPVSPAGVGMISFRSILATRVNRILDTSRKLSTHVGNLSRTLLISGGLTGAMAAGFVGLGSRSLQTPLSSQDASPQARSLEETGVQYWASEMRYGLDRVVFPPQGKGSRDPGVLRAALGSVFRVNSVLNELEAQPDVYLKVVKRLEKWSPDYPADYNPGWKYTHRLDEAAIAKEVAKVRELLLPALRKKAILLNDPRVQEAMVELAEHQKRLDDTALDITYKENFNTQVKARAKIHAAEWELIPESRWHAKVGWKAKDYFTDPDVIKLCHAIETNDLRRMRELIDQGVNVNAIGKDNMTTLLWSYPDLKFERFQMLLEAGADPNVMAAAKVRPEGQRFQPILWPRGLMSEDFRNGSSVNLLAYQTVDTRYWRTVIKHGGDVNQGALLEILMKPFHTWDRAAIVSAVKAVVEKGGDVNKRGNGPSLLSMAIKDNRFELATLFVKSGAVMNEQTGKRKNSNHYGQTPTQLLASKKPFGYYADRPGHSDELNASDRKRAAERGVKLQALHDLMVEHGAIFEPEQISIDHGLAGHRASRLAAMISGLQKKQRRFPGATKNYRRIERYSWIDYVNPARKREFQKYYSHVSRDFSEPTSGINFSIKHVTKDQLKDVKTTLPDFTAIRARRDSSVLIAPSFSGHSEWLEVHGGIWEDYLRSLTVKKCNLLERASADFPDLPANKDGYYFIEVANTKGRNELLIPAPYLRDEKLRKESGLEAFAEVWKILDVFKMRAFLGNQHQTGAIVAESNQQLKTKFRDAEFRFYLEHLTTAKLDANEVLHCTFEFSAPSEAETKFKYTASCKRSCWADDAVPRKRLAELKIDKKAMLDKLRVDRQGVDKERLRNVEKEISALERTLSDYQLSVEVTRQ